MSVSSRLRVILGSGDFSRRGFTEEKSKHVVYDPWLSGHVCHDAIEYFISRGGRGIDTALVYAGGKSEKIIGNYKATSPNASSMSIHTKVNPWGENSLSRESVSKQASTCLESLQTSCVDILYLHAPDHNTPIEETLAAVQQLYTEGKFKEFGVCNYASWEVAHMYQICKSNGWVLPTVYQGMYNAITRSIENELIPALRYFGIRFNAYNPTACGMLTGKYSFSDFEQTSEELKQGRFFCDPKWSSLYRDRYWRESVFRGVELVRKALDKSYGADKVSLVSATFRWLNHHSQLSPDHNDGIIIGASCLDHIVANLKCCEEGPLDDRVVKAFDEACEMDKRYCVNYFR